jgi:glycosyltransferase involved in cell wall biosynthesis
MKVTFVILSYNEVSNIEKCLKSVIAAGKKLLAEEIDSEIILVDDDSSDNTVEIAKKFPIKIVKHKKNLGTGAVCYTGSRVMSKESDYLITVGGDMVIHPDAIIKGLGVLKKNPNIGVISGVHKHIGLKMKPELQYPKKENNEDYYFIETFAGSGIYRVVALKKAGTFNPNLRLREESDVCLRFIEHGYKIAMLNNKISTHYGYRHNTFWTVRRKKFKRSFLETDVIVASKSYKNIYKARMKEFLPSVLTFLHLIILLTIFTIFVLNGILVYFYIIIMLLSLHFCISIILKRSFKWGIQKSLGLFFNCIPISYAVFLSIFKKLPSCDKFDDQVIVIKE